MGLPLPQIGAGGVFLDMQNALNSLENARHTTRYNKSKADYAPLTVPAQALSQMAYANAVGPQFIAKIMQDKGFLGNTPDTKLQSLREMITNFGTGQGQRNELMNNINKQQQGFSGTGQPSTNTWTRNLKNIFNSAMGKPQQQSNNPVADIMRQFQQPQQSNKQQPQQPMNLQESIQPTLPTEQQAGVPASNDGINHDVDAASLKWMNSPEIRDKMDKGIPVTIPSDDELLRQYGNKDAGMQLTVNKGINPSEVAPKKSYLEAHADYLGNLKQGEESGTIRGKDIGELGQQKLQLSSAKSNIDTLINDFTDPKFMELRDKFPYLQDTQLSIAAHTGSQEQQDMIGHIISNLESYKGSTINSFKGQTLKREFDYADKIKPNESDTVYTALGKMRALKSLNEVAYRKNSIITDLMENKHMSLSKAVEKADKMVDITAIDKEVKDLTSPLIKIDNNKDPTMSLYLTKSRAKELGFLK